MRKWKLLVKKEVTLKGLYITYDSDHCQNELKISCDPDVVTGTGRKATCNQLKGICKILYGDSKKAATFFHTQDVNLLSKPLSCDLVFVDNTLVAISNKDTHLFCYLATGAVVDEETLFETCKSAKQESMLSTINFLNNTLNEMMVEYDELKKMNFQP